MGILLSTPQESIGFKSASSSFISFVSAEMQGYRDSMEDAISTSLSLPSHPNHAILAVFDGHRTASISNWLAQNLVTKLDQLSELNPDTIRDKILDLDTDLQKQNFELSKSGSTIILALIRTDKYPYPCFIFNLGDSRAFIYKKYSDSFIPLSFDHKPDLPTERDRIYKAGGTVSNDPNCPRVDGDLAMSRAFGDSELKLNTALPPSEQKVIALADYQETSIEEGDYLFLTCDGIFEGVSSWDPVFKELSDRYISKHAEEAYYDSESTDLKDMAKGLIHFALACKSNDNMSLIAAKFLCKNKENAKVFAEKEEQRYFLADDISDKIEKDKFLNGYFCMAKKSGLSKKEALEEGFKSKILALSMGVQNEKNGIVKVNLKENDENAENDKSALDFAKYELNKYESLLHDRMNLIGMESEEIEKMVNRWREIVGVEKDLEEVTCDEL